MNSLQIEFRMALWDITIMPRRLIMGIQEAFPEIWKSEEMKRLEISRAWDRESIWDWNWNPAGPLMYGKDIK